MVGIVVLLILVIVEGWGLLILQCDCNDQLVLREMFDRKCNCLIIAAESCY